MHSNKPFIQSEELVRLCTKFIYFKRKFLLLINISNRVLGWQSAYHFQQERATASVELLEATVKVISLPIP